MTLLARTTERHAQPLPDVLAGQPRGLLLQAPDGPRAARDLRRRPDRDDRLPVGRGPDPPAAGPVRRRSQAAADFRDIFGAENYFCELMDHGLGIERRVQHDLLRLAKQLGLPLVATNDLHYTRAEDAQAHAVLLCVQSGSTLADPKRFKFDADEFYLKSPHEMRDLWREFPEACDNTLLIAERCDVTFTEGERQVHAPLPVPDGETEESWFVKEVERGLHRRYPHRRPRRGAQAGGRTRSTSSSEGLPRLLPGGRRLHQLGQGARHPGRAWPRLGRRFDVRVRDADHRPRPARARPDLRAVPQPRARVDARLRRRLRRAPSRRGDPLRHREVRRRPGRADRHLRHDQGQAGPQGLPRVLGYPYALGERHDQGHASVGDGQGHPAGGHLRPRDKRYKEADEFRELHESDADVAAGGRDRARPGEPEAPVGRARRWRHHVQRAADRPHPDHEARAGRRDHHAVRLPDLREARAGQDGLPGAAQPHRPRRRPAQREANGKRRRRAGERSQDLDDKATYELLGRGDTLGVFQLDGGPMRALLRLMRPDNFEDISAVGALYRPGPDGRQLAHDYALRKNKPQESPRSTPSSPSRWPTILGTPTA